jgi:hypothetical protein
MPRSLLRLKTDLASQHPRYLDRFRGVKLFNSISTIILLTIVANSPRGIRVPKHRFWVLGYFADNCEDAATERRRCAISGLREP